jgi:hypothetical protein
LGTRGFFLEQNWPDEKIIGCVGGEGECGITCQMHCQTDVSGTGEVTVYMRDSMATHVARKPDTHKKVIKKL